jgi:hypothetical protein
MSEFMKILIWKPTVLLKRNHYIKYFFFNQNVANKNTNIDHEPPLHEIAYFVFVFFFNLHMPATFVTYSLFY